MTTAATVSPPCPASAYGLSIHQQQLPSRCMLPLDQDAIALRQSCALTRRPQTTRCPSSGYIYFQQIGRPLRWSNVLCRHPTTPGLDDGLTG